ncbi:hypothetical protein WICMUC_005471 [Wickerhamomyces mucosus]|uniref:DNA polymerase n=1 Tax=Wickerhamomyces mucosus TaxID=1378264 RepID=A0A9P8T633_9ASCO|nr:hypothetical protein WICMUC_005471 [Wickerhamomyces mucosus]
MSKIFNGSKFLFIPNSTSKLTIIRKKLAQSHGAVIIDRLLPNCYVLIDTKLYSKDSQIVKKIVELGGDKPDVKYLNQGWLVDSTQKLQKLDDLNYKINVTVPRLSSPSIRNSSPETKRQKYVKPLTRSEIIESNLNRSIIGSSNNPNSYTIEILSQMAEQRDIQGDNPFKSRAYKIAIDSLQKTPKYIDTYDKAIKIPGIGQSIAEKIEEICTTSNLRLLNQLQKSEKNQLMQLFKGIYSVGNTFAQKWIDEGMKSLEDISQRKDLSSLQKLGLKYYQEWNERISRKEATLHREYIMEVMLAIDPDVEFTIGGSYRRGSETSGDIDFIITKEDTGLIELKFIVNKLLENLKITGYHKCSLTTLSNKWLGGGALTPEYNSKLKGDIKTDEWGKCRRIDFLLVPWDQKGASFIYFTGNNDFNKKIRLKASKRGMILNDAGLFQKQDIKNDKGEIVDSKLILLESHDEKKIFEILDVKWREPNQRNIGSNFIL